MSTNPHAVRLLSTTADTVTLGGYGVVFGGVDMYGTRFEPDTDYGALLSSGALPVYYDHTIGGEPTHQLGTVIKAQADDKGLWIEAQLERHADYVAEVLDLAEQGVLGWSSGSASHLVRMDKDGITIRTWPIVEFSLTPTPAEPRTLSATVLRARQSSDDTSDYARRITALEEEVFAMRTKAPRHTGGTVTPTNTNDGAFRAYMLRGTRSGLQEDIGHEGGILVPEGLSPVIVKTLSETSALRRAGAKTVPVSGTSRYRVPKMTSKGAAQLTREEDDYAAEQPGLQQLEFVPYKYTRLTKVSEELLIDARTDILREVITPDAAMAFADAENEAFTIGTGAGQPQGILNGLDTTYQHTTAAAGVIDYDDIIDTRFLLDLPYRDKASWLVSDDAAKAMSKLKDGNGDPLWQPSLQNDQPDRLLGRPVITTKYLPDVASGNVVAIFGDFSYYWIALFGELSVQRLNELFAANGQVGFRWHRRMDGRVMLSEAFASLIIA